MAKSVTRGSGLLEATLAKRRAAVANRLIPAEARRGRILDVGCGTRPMFLLGTRFVERYGLDKVVPPHGDPELEAQGIRLLRHDVGAEVSLPFEADHFEVVTMLAVFEHLEPPVLIRTLREIHRVLKSGGRFVMTTPSGWTDPILKTMARIGLVSAEEIDEHQDAYTRRRIAALLESAGFASPEIRQGTFELFMNQWAVARK